MDYISRSCDLQKSEKWGMFIYAFLEGIFRKITKKGNLMTYVSRSHNPPKSENGEQVGVLT